MPIHGAAPTELRTDLGRIVSRHPIAAVYVQRAAIVALVSFVFFLLMLVAFSIRRHFGYFLLSSAFLVVYLFTMLGWWLQKQSVVTIYENGIAYKKFNSTWGEVAHVNEAADAKGAVTITLTDRKKRSVTIPPTIDGAEMVADAIRTNVPRSS